MSEWEPATDAEVAMRDALRTDDQESYFRILAGVDLLLPVSAEALQGLAPLGWGTWSTGGRTHVLAFTSSAALESCLADYNGSARRVPYAELANTWPNLEWWLAVNPGLPIEGYLPAWFVAQLSRGDLRLPTRGPGREKSPGATRIQDLHTAAMAANAAAANMEEAAAGAAPQGLAGAPPAGFQRPTSAPPAGFQQAASFQQPASASPAGLQPASAPPAGFRPMSAPPAGFQRPVSAPPGFEQPTSAPPAGYEQPTSAPPAGFQRPASAPPAGYQPTSAPPAGFQRPMSAPPAGYQQPLSAPPAAPASPAYAQRAMGVPSAAAAGYPQPVSAPPGAARPAIGGAPPGYAQAAAATQMPQLPAADEAPPPPVGPGPEPAPAAQPQIGPGGLPIRTPGTVLPSGLPSRASSAAPTSAVPVPAPAAPPVPPAYNPPTLPAGAAAGGTGAWPTIRPGGGADAGADPRGPMQDPRGPMQDPRGPMQDPRGPMQGSPAPLPVRTPMANTPPVPEHLAGRPADDPPLDPRWSGAPAAAPPPLADLPRRLPTPAGDQPGGFPEGGFAQAAPGGGLPQRQASPGGGFPQGQASPGGGFPQGQASPGGGFPQGPASPQAAAAQRPGVADQPAPGFGTPLPRRQANPGSEPAPMTSFPAFKTPAEQAASAAAQAAAPTAPSRPGLTPPVIPGSPGSDRPARLGAAPQPPPLDVRGGAPMPPSRPMGPPSQQPPGEPFHPANDVERDLYDAADGGSTDQFLSTLLLATVLVPVAHHSRPGSAPGESGFVFRTDDLDGERFLTVFTSKDRLAEHYAEPTRTASVRFYDLIRNWPDPAWSFSVNPGGPIGAKYPGPQVIALASWAAEAGLGADPAEHDEPGEPVPAPAPANDDAQHATVMQKTLPPDQVDYYLERGYDRVAGFVHRATEVEHLRTPGELFGALGLLYGGSPHQGDAKEAYVLRWPAYRPSLYRIPYGGQNEQALKAMDGWVIERAPFRGNGFAPGEGRDVIAEFKVDSVRLPHGAQLWRIDADGAEHMVAIFDNDGPQWRRVGEQ